MRGQRNVAKQSGGALASTLLIVLLLFIFGLTLANLATFNLRLVNKNGERQKAFEAAEAGLSKVIADISRDPRVGTNNEVFQATLSNGSRYRVSFATTGPGIKSINNIANLSKATRASDGVQVPAFHALIVAEGTSKAGDTAAVETLVRLEAIPYAIAGTGKVSAPGAIVYGAYTGIEAQAARTNPSLRQAGSTYSGSSDIDSSNLPGAAISGDVVSVGGANADPLLVGGDILDQQDPDQLPDFTISDFSTENSPGRTIRPGGNHILPLTLSGPWYFENSVRFPLPIVLNNATIYVANGGNLEANLMVGTGTLFVTGETRFLANVNLGGANNRLTVFSEGDITISLAGVFNGAFLTHGNFTASGALVVFGAIYANSPTPGLGNVNLNTLASIVAHVQEYTTFATYVLSLGGAAKPIMVYWNQLY